MPNSTTTTTSGAAPPPATAAAGLSSPGLPHPHTHLPQSPSVFPCTPTSPAPGTTTTTTTTSTSTTAQRTAEARAAFTASLSSVGASLDSELQARSLDVHANAGALARQEKALDEATKLLRREGEMMEREIGKVRGELDGFVFSSGNESASASASATASLFERLGWSGGMRIGGGKGAQGEGAVVGMGGLEALLGGLERELGVLEDMMDDVEGGGEWRDDDDENGHGHGHGSEERGDVEHRSERAADVPMHGQEERREPTHEVKTKSAAGDEATLLQPPNQ